MTNPNTTTTRTRTIHLHVQGMMCQRNCGTTVATALQRLEGAVNAAALFDEQRAWVTLVVSQSDDHAMNATNPLVASAIDAVEAVGFDATWIEHLDAFLQQQQLHEPCLDLHVEGMMCQQNCGTTVQRALEHCDFVERAHVSFAQQRATIWLRSNHNDKNNDDIVQAAIEAIEDVGFDARLWNEATDGNNNNNNHQQVEMASQVPTQATSFHDDTTTITTNPNDAAMTFSLTVEGMSCAVCTGRVEAAILAVPGVDAATVVLSTQRATVTAAATNRNTHDNYDAESLLPHNQGNLQSLAQACQQAVQQAGYTCRVLAQDTSLQENAQQMQRARIRERHEWRTLFVAAAMALLPITIIHYGHVGQGSMTSMMLVFGLATAAQFGVGQRFYKAAYAGWTHGRTLGMDFLIVLGTTASYVYSVVIVLLHTVLGNWDDHAHALEPTFMTGVMLLTFVSLGKWLEAIAKGNTCLAIQSLMEMQPATAWRVVLSNDEVLRDAAAAHTLDWGALQTEQVASTDIVPGDYVKVLPGERLPADGILVAMASSSLSSKLGGGPAVQAFIDESSFSGEPFPVSKQKGDTVLGGTVNQSTVLLIQVTAAGRDSWLAKIVQLVEDAQRHKAPIQVYADRVAAIFAPIVVSIAAVTLVFWLIMPDQDNAKEEMWEERVFVAIMSAISVVVVACPCALGLATPCAVLVGTGVAAGHGLLIKGGDVLEKMQAVNTVVFDKTGTITSGDAKLSSVKTFVTTNDTVLQNLPPEVNPSNLVLWLACVAELNSEHPIGQAIVQAGKAIWGDDIPRSKHGVSLNDFRAEPGNGVECVLESASWGTFGVRVGKREWAKAHLNGSADNSLKADDTMGDEDVDTMRRRGEIAVYVSIWNCRAPEQQRNTVGVLSVNDPIKVEAPSTVRALRRMGIDVWMCTGDSSVTALAVAEEVGIRPENVRAGVSPTGKGEMVSELQQGVFVTPRSLFFWKPTRRTVAMVADGVNDAVALAKSDVGFAIGAGTEVAVEAADVVLVRSDLHDVVVALHLSSVVFRRILFNLCCAMVYNVCALPFAAGLLTPFTDFRLPPAAAGFMMAISSVSVVTSSLLLRTYRKPMISEDGQLNRVFGEVRTSIHKGLLSQKYSGVPTTSSEMELV